MREPNDYDKLIKIVAVDAQDDKESAKLILRFAEDIYTEPVSSMSAAIILEEVYNESCQKYIETKIYGNIVEKRSILHRR